MKWSLNQHATCFYIFACFYLCFFSVFPLQGALPFTCDGFIYTSLANRFYNFVTGLFTGTTQGTFFYPVDNPYAYGEFAPAHSFFFTVFKLVLQTDLLTSWFYISLVYASNAFSTYLVTWQLTRHRLSAFFAGTAFSFSNFAFANNDDYYVFTLAPAILSLYFYLRYFEEKKTNLALAGAVLLGVQIYFSAQSFAYSLILLGLFFIAHIGPMLKKGQLPSFLFSQLLMVAVALPQFLVYLHHHLHHYPVNVWGDSTGLFARVEHLFRPLPDSIMGKLLSLEPVKLNWFTIKLHMFTGLTVVGLAIYGLFKNNKYRYTLLAVILMGILFSLGKVIHAFGYKFDSPLKLLFEYIPLAEYLRVSWRAYFITTLGLSMAASMGLVSFIQKKPGWRITILCLALALHLLENISYPPNKYEYSKYPKIPRGYSEYFKDKPKAVIFDLPSNAISVPAYFDDTIYMHYQTKHRRNIMGGVFGYFPPERLLHQKYLYRMPEQKSIDYFKKQGLTHFVWHKRFSHIRNHMSLDFFYFTIEKERKRLNHMGASLQEPLVDNRSFIEEYDWLTGADFLKKEYEDEHIIIFKWKQ